LLLDPDDPPGTADEGIVDDADLTRLMDAFRVGACGEKMRYQIEVPFVPKSTGEIAPGNCRKMQLCGVVLLDPENR
jgi:DNA helicase-2/ATP-dependent DNA helicase PcrA